MQKKSYVYIMTNSKDSIMYVGVTGDLKQRMEFHLSDTNKGFTGKYKVHKLVYYEVYTDIRDAISREKHHIFRSFNQWRTAILHAFGYDPLKCECGATMLFLKLYYKHKPVSLEEMYEKVMSRSREKRSSA